ncbi:predicted protein [Streptomyces viridosporus ATCC 14672]|uniref:Predicted protein n=1 Tax=Streptomyces viridosporus (strain ATCC 14672 / DSM 40746 / JCM 4963 / KCTC 9882 / NRRL B-12104 / FH 1290) TaxID=566461 RepID=D6A2L1_STRV1|nr:predicted protein [Streptomyces viridosporus ATCC 14672]
MRGAWSFARLLVPFGAFFPQVRCSGASTLPPVGSSADPDWWARALSARSDGATVVKSFYASRSGVVGSRP